MMDGLEGTKYRKVHSNLDCKKDIVHPACPIYMVEGLVISFG